MNYVNLNLAGHIVRVGYRNQKAADSVARYACSSDGSDAELNIELGEEYEERTAQFAVCTSESYREYLAMMFKISEVLMGYGVFCFHGAAFRWRDKAYIFVAPSGTGKTTQLKNWLKLYGDEIEVINGDKPMLEFRDDGKVYVHPSPWNGKEQMSGSVSAPLDSLIYLKQDSEDRVEATDGRDLVQNIYHQIFVLVKDISAVQKVASLEEYLLSHCRIFELYNRGTEESAIMLHDFLSE